MRPSTLIFLAIAAAADPVVTSPIAASGEFSDVESSGAASLINMLAGLAVKDLENTDNHRQRCDALELEDLFARAEDSNKESSAEKLELAANIASVGSIILSSQQSLRACSDSAKLLERARRPTSTFGLGGLKNPGPRDDSADVSNVHEGRFLPLALAALQSPWGLAPSTLLVAMTPPSSLSVRGCRRPPTAPGKRLLQVALWSASSMPPR